MGKNYESTWNEQASAPDHTTLLAAGQWLIYFTSAGMWVLESDGTAHGPFNAGTVPSTTGEIFLSAAGMWPSTTAGCAANAKTEYTTNDQDLYGLAFDQTTEEYAQATVWMPADWNGGTVTAQFVWTAAAGTGDVIWALQGISYANDDAIDAAWGTAQTVTDTLIATGDVHYTAATSAITLAGTPAAGELVQFRAYRDADAGGDTLSGDAVLLGIKLIYGRA